jgi:hypothetical protein
MYSIRQERLMSPTFLELAVALVLLMVAWQLGVALAPLVFRKLRELMRDIDSAGEHEHIDNGDQDISHEPHRKDHTNGTHR